MAPNTHSRALGPSSAGQASDSATSEPSQQVLVVPASLLELLELLELDDVLVDVDVSVDVSVALLVVGGVVLDVLVGVSGSTTFEDGLKMKNAATAAATTTAAITAARITVRFFDAGLPAGDDPASGYAPCGPDGGPDSPPG